MSAVISMSSDRIIQYSRPQRLEAQLDAIARIGQTLNLALEVVEILNRAIEITANATALEGLMIALAAGDRLQPLAVHGCDKAQLAGVTYGRGEGLLGQLWQTGQAKILDAAGADPHFLNRLALYDPQGPLILVPICHGEEIFGAIAAQPAGSREQRDDDERLLALVADLLAPLLALRQRQYAQEELADRSEARRRQQEKPHGFSNFIGHAPAMLKIFDQMRQVAKWDTTVLIRGESGTGKELVAMGIHYNSPRANAAFIKINCAALPDTLLESELFGHEKGAFTGAINQRKGRFEQANGGTLFLDELGEISPAFQAKLLRVLQEGEFERIGGSQTLRVDVRIIAATHRNLEQAVEEGKFREDLYYRLNVMPIYTPPLRERIGDIPDLADFLVQRLAKRQQRSLEITDSAIRLLARHDWPGNVRELENCLERAAVMSESGRIDRDAISITGLEDKVVSRPLEPAINHKVDLDDPDLDERERIIAALEHCGWVQAKAARLLNMTPRQIAYRIQIMNIRMRRI